MWLTDVLATFHILFAVLWLGGGVMFGIVIAPKLAAMPPPASREFFIKVVPTVLRFFQVVPALAVGFGLLLVANMTGGDWSMLSPNNSWGLSLSFGITTAVAAFVVGEAGAAPALRRLIKVMESLGAPGGSTPNQIPPAIARSRNLALVSLVLLLLTMAFMVAAGFY